MNKEEKTKKEAEEIETNIDGLVTFCILMENNRGILGKAPSYLYEKYEMSMKMQNPSQLLDTINKAKFDRYMKIWFREEE